MATNATKSATTTCTTTTTTTTTSTSRMTNSATTPAVAQPAAPLGYAESASTATLPQHIRATPLLAPNLLALLVLFLPLLSGETPLAPVERYVRELVRTRAQPHGSVRWEAMITGPFLLAIPLALWTIRLSRAPRPRAAERAAAWSVTLASITMTILCMGYCMAGSSRRFWLSILITMVVLGAAAWGVAALWRLRRAWPTALIAMTGAWAVNAILTMSILLTHAPWSVGIVAALLAIAAQIIVGIVCVSRWRWDG